MRRFAMDKENLILSWDTCDITDEKVKDLMAENPLMTEDEARESTYNDPMLFEFEWDYLCEALSEVIKDLNPDGKWSGQVENFGWRGQSGSNDFDADNGQDFLSKILPKTDCTFYIYKYKEGDLEGLAINNYHHDSPTGKEWYYILPYQDLEEENEER
jgi:hypothetical protein